MLGLLWSFFELMLFKNILEALGYNWLLIFGVALVILFLKLLFVGVPSDDYRINYRP